MYIYNRVLGIVTPPPRIISSGGFNNLCQGHFMREATFADSLGPPLINLKGKSFVRGVRASRPNP